jgi:hypothetical protein
MSETKSRGTQIQSRIGRALVCRANELSMLRLEGDYHLQIALLGPLASALARVAAVEDAERSDGLN